MNKSKLCCFAIAGMLGIAGLSPVTTLAAETTMKTTALSESKDCKEERKAEFEEKMKTAKEKWNQLTQKQKDEIYTLVEDKMKVESNLMDKLVEFGVIEKTDAANIQKYKEKKFNQLKESGEFPIFRKRGNKNRN